MSNEKDTDKKSSRGNATLVMLQQKTMVARQYLVHWPQYYPCLSPKLQIQRAKLKCFYFCEIGERRYFNIIIAMNEEEEFSRIPKTRLDRDIQEGKKS